MIPSQASVTARRISAGMSDVLTLRLDPGSQRRFDLLRETHFPPERNLIPAHLTLFHSLPAEPSVAAALAAAAAGRHPFPLEVTGLRSLGKGVAYRLESPTLLALHRSLSESFNDVLIPQDRHRFDPHVVVQNKVTPDAARTLLAHLQAGFTRWSVQAEGLDLWHYRGGPWEHAQTFLFP